ncbi:MAG: Crp/Fnr family transcriptional regulator [Gammaproteobacteria bacterium]|jgi:hypothetical protein
MNPLTTNLNRGSDEKRLVRLFKALQPEQRVMLLEFAEFLSGRGEAQPAEIPAPKEIPRQEGESVIKAMKRLSASYYMLDKGKMLNETSTLMAQHVMQGRPAVEVIDELEILFETHYRKLRDENE